MHDEMAAKCCFGWSDSMEGTSCICSNGAGADSHVLCFQLFLHGGSQLKASHLSFYRLPPSPPTPAVKLLFYLFPGDDDNAGSRSGNDRKWREALRSLWRLIPRAMLVKVGAVEV